MYTREKTREVIQMAYTKLLFSFHRGQQWQWEEFERFIIREEKRRGRGAAPHGGHNERQANQSDCQSYCAGPGSPKGKYEVSDARYKDGELCSNTAPASQHAGFSSSLQSTNDMLWNEQCQHRLYLRVRGHVWDWVPLNVQHYRIARGSWNLPIGLFPSGLQKQSLISAMDVSRGEDHK